MTLVSHGGKIVCMENEKIQTRIDTRRARVMQIREKMDSLKRQMETYQRALTKYEAELEKTEGSLAKMEAIVAGVAEAETELQAVLAERLELGNKLSVGWKPDPNVKGDAQGFWTDAEYLKLTNRMNSLNEFIAAAEGKVNTIFYGKA